MNSLGSMYLVIFLVKYLNDNTRQQYIENTQWATILPYLAARPPFGPISYIQAIISRYHILMQIRRYFLSLCSTLLFFLSNIITITYINNKNHRSNHNTRIPGSQATFWTYFAQSSNYLNNNQVQFLDTNTNIFSFSRFYAAIFLVKYHNDITCQQHQTQDGSQYPHTWLQGYILDRFPADKQ